MSISKQCVARRNGRDMECSVCGLQWSLDDDDKPDCGKLVKGNQVLADLRVTIRPPANELVSLRETPLNWLPIAGTPEGLVKVEWNSYPDVGYAMIRKPPQVGNHVRYGRDYTFLGHNGQPKFQVEVWEDFDGRQAYRRECLQGGMTEWVPM